MYICNLTSKVRRPLNLSRFVFVFVFWAVVCELLKTSPAVFCFIAEVAVSRQHELISSNLLVNHLYLVTVSIYACLIAKLSVPQMNQNLLGLLQLAGGPSVVSSTTSCCSCLRF